jgi:hypothetical protein
MGSPSSTDEFAKDWMTKIEKADLFIDRYTTRKRWKDYKEYYRGNWSDQVLPVNMIFAVGRAMVPNTYFRDPKVCISANRPEYVWHARVVEAVDNWLTKELKIKETLKMAALDAYWAGTAIIKLGYDSEFGYIPDQALDQDNATATEFSKKSGERIEYRENVKAGMPWALVCNPEDIIVPAGYRTPSSLPWICHRILRPLEDVKEDQKYRNTKDLAGTRIVNLQRGGRKPFDRDEDETMYAELFEVRDVRTKMIYVFCEGQTLLKDIDALQIDGLPYEFITFNPDPELFWGIPDVKMIEQQQLELNEVKTQQKKHRAIALVKFLYKKGVLTKPQLDLMLSGEVGPAVEVEDDSIATAITMLQPHVPPEFMALQKDIKEDIRVTVGSSSNQQGDFSPYHGKTAAESMIVNQANELRGNERKDVLGDCLANIVRKWNQMIFKYWTNEKVIEICGPKGQQYWVQYTGDELTGEYFINIDPESGMPMTRAQRGQATEQLLKTFNGDPMIDQIKLRMMVLREFEMINPEASSLLLQGPQGMAQDIAASRQPGPVYGGPGGTGGARPASGPGPGGGVGQPGSGAQALMTKGPTGK